MLINVDSTKIAAWTGSIVSIGLGIFEFYKWKSSKPKIDIKCNFDQQIISMGYNGKLRNEHPDKNIWTIQLLNKRSQPIKVSTIGIEYKKKIKMKGGAIITRDLYKNINPFILPPGEQFQVFLEYKLIDPKNVKSVIVKDAVGKKYIKKI
jgi:hypothetical protein